MIRVLLLIWAALFAVPTAAGADPTAFQGGTADPSEVFGATDGTAWFVTALAALAVIYALMVWGRQVHRRTAQELEETERLLEEKS